LGQPPGGGPPRSLERRVHCRWVPSLKKTLKKLLWEVAKGERNTPPSQFSNVEAGESETKHVPGRGLLGPPKIVGMFQFPFFHVGVKVFDFAPGRPGQNMLAG